MDTSNLVYGEVRNIKVDPANLDIRSVPVVPVRPELSLNFKWSNHVPSRLPLLPISGDCHIQANALETLRTGRNTPPDLQFSD